MDTTLIDAAIDQAFDAALANTQSMEETQVADNTTLRVDTYEGPKGSGFSVTATINLTPQIQVFPVKLSRVKQHGPETDRETAWPSDEQAAAQVQVATIKTLRAGLLTAWEQTFTVGERSFLKPIFTDALAAFDRGDIAGCKELVATAPSVTAELDAKRAQIVALFL